MLRRLTGRKPEDVRNALHLANGRLYFTTQSGVFSVSLEGGAARTEAGVGGVSLVSCADHVCMLGGGSALMASLVRLEPDAAPTLLSSGIVEPHDVVFDGEFFYIAGGRGSISRISADGGPPVPIYAEPGITSLEIEGSCLYWSSATSISSVSIDAARTAHLPN